MKKFISVAVAVMLAFAVSAPAFATTASYLPDSTATTGNRTLFALDFDSAATIDAGCLSDYTVIKKNAPSATSPELKTDPQKSGQSMYLAQAASWDGIQINWPELGLTSSDKLFIEFSFMTTSTSESAIGLQLAVTNTDVFEAKNGTIFVNKATETVTTYEANKWYHIVLQFKHNYITVFVNGEDKGTYGNATMYKLDSLNNMPSGNNYLTIGAAGGGTGVYLDDVKSWISTTAYNASDAGDSVDINVATDTGLTVDGDEIVWANTMTTLADVAEKLSVTTGATGPFYFNADGSEITDPDTALVEGIKVVARSESGASVKAYTLAAPIPPELTSEVYEIDDDAKTISGVPYMTKVEDFEAGLTPATGKTLTVTSSNGYADAATTVTVDGTAYTVLNESYVWEDFATLTNLGSANIRAGSNNTSDEGIADTGDTLKGGKAIYAYDTAAGKLFNAHVASGVIPTLEAGEILNLEFNIKADGYHTSYVQFVNLPNGGLNFTADGKITAINSTIDTGATYVPNEWYHIVISYKRLGHAGTHNTFRLYINGEEVKNPGRPQDGYYPNSSMGVTGVWFGPVLITGEGTKIWLDDYKCYKAATQEYDEAYMTGNQLVTSSDYVVDGRTVYVPADDVAGAVWSLGFPDAPIINADGSEFNPDEVNIGDSFYILENGSDGDASRVSKYTLAETNVLTASGDKISAAFNGNGIIIGASYDAEGNMIDAKVFDVDMEKTTADLSSLEGATVKAYLWSDMLKPYSVLTKGADGTWN